MALKFEFFGRVDIAPFVEKIRDDRWNEIVPAEFFRTVRTLAHFAKLNMKKSDLFPKSVTRDFPDLLPEDATRDFLYGSEAADAIRSLCAALTRRAGAPKKHSSGYEIDGSGQLRLTTSVEVIRRKVLYEPALLVREVKRLRGNAVSSLAAILAERHPRLDSVSARREAADLLKKFSDVDESTTDRELRRRFGLRTRDLPKPRKPTK